MDKQAMDIVITRDTITARVNGLGNILSSGDIHSLVSMHNCKEYKM